MVILVIGTAPTGSSASPAGGSRGPVRATTTGRPPASVQTPGIHGRSSVTRVPAPEVAATVTTVDGDQYAGGENAIYAPDRQHVFVAYKRFLRDAFDPGGDVVEAELRVAISDDGGATWDVQILTSDAAEEGDVIQQSVAIDGDGNHAVWIAYMVQNDRGSFLRFARTEDDGDHWTLGSVARFAGEYKAMQVLGPESVLIASNHQAPGDPELRLYGTTDGGLTWTRSLVDKGADWYVGFDRGFDGRLWISFYDGGDTDLLASTAKSAAGPWTTRVIGGTGDDEFFTGVFSSLDLSLGTIYVACEDFQPSLGRSVVRLYRSTDGGAHWTWTIVDSAFAIGWNTTVHTLRSNGGANTDVYLSYWHEYVKPPVYRGHVRVAHSVDGGETWSVWTIPESRSVLPDIDSAAPALDTQFVSYAVWNRNTGHRFLRVARLDLSQT